jgi:hypothetical protein
MSRPLSFCPLALLLILLLPLVARAWNSQGHQVIAQIAYNHLDAAVKAKCDALIKVGGLCSFSTNDTFVSASTWADARCEAGTSTEHYIDIPITLDGSSTAGVANDPTNILEALNRHILTLQNPASDTTNQARALRYIVHFVGDIEQPLHCSTGVSSNRLTGDLGGNSFSLGGGNLHSFWDSGGGLLTNGSPVAPVAAAVEAAYPYVTSFPSIPNATNWANESWLIASNVTYVGVTNGFAASATYSNTVQQTTMQRLAAGGQRLAKLLSSIFVTNGPTLQAPALVGGAFKLTWDAVPGRSYRVQTKSTPGDASWFDTTEIMATTNSASFTEPLNQTQRFYRIAVVN